MALLPLSAMSGGQIHFFSEMKKKCLKTASVNVIIALNVTGAEKETG